VDKNKTPLGKSIDVIYDAVEHAKKYPSIAKDTGTSARFAQYGLTRIFKNLGSLMEIFDTQATGALLDLNVSLSSESNFFCDIQSCVSI
jgi:hypothetical protein